MGEAAQADWDVAITAARTLTCAAGSSQDVQQAVFRSRHIYTLRFWHAELTRSGYIRELNPEFSYEHITTVT